jgi:hypothetical protein
LPAVKGFDVQQSLDRPLYVALSIYKHGGLASELQSNWGEMLGGCRHHDAGHVSFGDIGTSFQTF